MTKIKEDQARAYFIKLCMDGDSKEDLAGNIWERMGADEREQYFKELEEMENEE